MGFNRKGTVSTVYTKIDKIIKLMIEEINKDEKIKRYLAFLTKQPLESYSVDNSGNKLYQYDIPKRIDCDIEYCISKLDAIKKNYRKSNQILFPYPYDDEKVNAEYPTMYVRNYSYNYNGAVSSNIYCIDILVPSKYMELEPYGENRIHKIMERIAYLFDGIGLDEESKKELGDLRFCINGRTIESKVTRSNMATLVSIPIEVRLYNARYLEDGYRGY